MYKTKSSVICQSVVLCVEFPRVQHIDLSEIVPDVKVVIFVTSVHLSIQC